MKHQIFFLFSFIGILAAENAFSQDVNGFSSDENKFSVGFQLSGAFPVGSFTNADISFPCNSSVNAGSAFELYFGYKYKPKWGMLLSLSAQFYEFDPTSSGAAELLSEHPGLYQSAAVLKSGELVSRSAMAGGYYTLPIGLNDKLFLKFQGLIGIMGSNVPEIEIVGTHPIGASDKNGNSIDTIESWDTPQLYAYSLTYRAGVALSYSLNKRIIFFINLNYQGSTLNFINVPVTYNLYVSSSNSVTGNSTTLVNANYLKEVNPTIYYQAISVGLGCEINF
jgi:hypothetical protein